MICQREDDPYEELYEANHQALLAEGFDDAYMGFVANTHHTSVAVYDYDECVRVLREDGMTEEEAIEYMDYNVVDAYVGEHGPLFLRGCRGS
jgi:hypothetical protein